MFIGNSGNKAEANAAGRQKRAKEDASDDATLGPDRKTPQTEKKQMLHN